MPALDSTEVPLGQVVAANVRRLREGKGMSVTDLARKTGLTVGRVDEVQNGSAGDLQATELEAIADALGVYPMDLVRSAPKDA